MLGGKNGWEIEENEEKLKKKKSDKERMKRPNHPFVYGVGTVSGFQGVVVNYYNFGG